ncbi:transglutaminase domain-containing protein [bacterium]|nr:transglutaminase domain-containing protein [bacterium]
MARNLLASALILLLCTDFVAAQFGQGSTTAPSFVGGETFETGFTLEVAADASGITATFPVPADWDDQKAELVQKDVYPTNASVRFIDLDGTKQARVDIPRLAAGDTAKVLLRYQVDRKPIVPPSAPETLLIPDSRQLSRDERIFLLPSPSIESRDAKIVDVVKSLEKTGAKPWQQVEAYYDFVHENVAYENGPMKGALAALNEGRGDCEEMTTLFVALCRAGSVPARTVWVPGHCYPEFLAQDADGAKRWIPVEMTNKFPFGESPEKRPILQKGDNFRIPGSRKPQHYVKQELSIRDYRGATPPVVTWLPPPGKEPPQAISN